MTDTASTPDTVTLPPATPTVWPTVNFADADAAVRLLQALGFVVTQMHRDGDGAVVHAEARRRIGGGVMFGTTREDWEWSALGAQGVYVVAEDAAEVDRLYDAVRALPGVEIRRELNDTDYGNHEFTFRDQDGNMWSVGTYRGA